MQDISATWAFVNDVQNSLPASLCCSCKVSVGYSLVIYASVVAQSGPSMKAVALGVEEEKYSSVTAFVRLCLQALESAGEENVTKKRKFTFMKVRTYVGMVAGRKMHARTHTAFPPFP